MSRPLSCSGVNLRLVSRGSRAPLKSPIFILACFEHVEKGVEALARCDGQAMSAAPISAFQPCLRQGTTQSVFCAVSSLPLSPYVARIDSCIAAFRICEISSLNMRTIWKPTSGLRRRISSSLARGMK